MVSHPRDSKLQFLVQIAYTRFHLIPVNIWEEVLADIQANGQARFCVIISDILYGERTRLDTD